MMSGRPVKLSNNHKLIYKRIRIIGREKYIVKSKDTEYKNLGKKLLRYC